MLEPHANDFREPSVHVSGRSNFGANGCSRSTFSLTKDNEDIKSLAPVAVSHPTSIAESIATALPTTRVCSVCWTRIDRADSERTHKLSSQKRLLPPFVTFHLPTQAPAKFQTLNLQEDTIPSCLTVKRIIQPMFSNTRCIS